MTKIVAHRGFSSRRLQNTIESFKLAFETKYIDMIELDIRMTKDKKIVCIHDNYIKFKLNRKDVVKNTNYDELRMPNIKDTTFWPKFFKYLFHVSSWTNLKSLIKYKNKKGKVPLLEEVLELLPQDKQVIIEIKNNKHEYDETIYTEEILKVIDKYKNKHLMVMSFDKDIVMLLKQKRSKLKVGLLIEKHLEYLESDVDFVSISKKTITKDILNKMVEQKKDVVVWTVNTYSDYLLLKKDLGELIIDISITTDYPDLVYYLLEKDKK